MSLDTDAVSDSMSESLTVTSSIDDFACCDIYCCCCCGVLVKGAERCGLRFEDYVPDFDLFFDIVTDRVPIIVNMVLREERREEGVEEKSPRVSQ